MENTHTHICEQKEGEEVHEGEGKLAVLLERVPDLLPADGDIVLALRQGRSGARLLVDDYGE